MKVVEFVKKLGWDEADRVFKNAPFGYPEIVVDDEGVSYGVGLTPLVGGFHFTLDDLKQLIEAKVLVDAYGGLGEAKYKLDDPMIDASEAWDLKQAIQLVESCL